MPVNAVVRNDIFKAFQFTDNECAVCPRACVGDVKVVSAFFWWKLGIRFVLDPVSKDRSLALELAALIAGLDLEWQLGGIFLSSIPIACIKICVPSL